MRRTASAAAVMAMTAALLPIPATLSSASAEPEEEGSAAPLVVDRITPDAADEDSTLRVAGEVTNTTGKTIEDVTVRMRYSRQPLTSRDDLDKFASGDGRRPSAAGPDEEFEGELEPDGTLGYSLSTPVEDLGLGSYGVYPLTVEALDGDGETIGSQHTFLPYTADDDVPALDLAWVWPLMDAPQRAGDDTFLSDDLHGSVGPEGRLGRLLQSGAQVPLSFEAGDEDLVEELGLEEDPAPQEGPPTAGEDATAEETADSLSPEETEQAQEEGGEETDGSDEDAEAPPSRTEGIPVTWSVDPGTLDDILRMAIDDHEVLEELVEDPDDGEPVRHDQVANEEAQVWLREARQVLAADTVVASPYANADLAALLRNDMASDAEASLRLGQEALARSLGVEADARFAVPAKGLLEDDVQDLLTENGAHRFLLDEEAVPPASWISTTPDAQAPLPESGDEEEGEEPYALVADSGLTDVLSMPSWGPGESTLALQRFAAETAMIAGEDTGGDRVVVAAPEPGWDPSPEFADGVLEATDGLPWLSPERLDRVEPPDAEERETRRDLTYPDHAHGDELSSTYLGQIEDVNRDVRLFNSILVGDSDPFRPAIVRLQSTYWQHEESTAGAVRSLVGQTLHSRREDVRVIPGEPVTLASSTGTTGVLVANDLEDESVYVYLSLYSENSERLSVGEYTHHFEIEPGAKTTVYVPLSARINGSTVVHVSLQNADGEPISSQDTLIQVNATGLGTQALLISGIGLLILIAALAPRALRKWARKQSAKANTAAADGDPEDRDAQARSEAESKTPAEPERTDEGAEAGSEAEDAAAPEAATDSDSSEGTGTQAPERGGSEEPEAPEARTPAADSTSGAAASDAAPAEGGKPDTGPDSPTGEDPGGDSADSGTGK